MPESKQMLTTENMIYFIIALNRFISQSKRKTLNSVLVAPFPTVCLSLLLFHNDCFTYLRLVWVVLDEPVCKPNLSGANIQDTNPHVHKALNSWLMSEHV